MPYTTEIMLQYQYNKNIGSESGFQTYRKIAMFDLVIRKMEQEEALAVFVDALGKNGKTFTLNTILSAVRTLNSQKNVAITIASSRITATLLLRSRPFYSKFKAKSHWKEPSILLISAQSYMTELMRR